MSNVNIYEVLKYYDDYFEKDSIVKIKYNYILNSSIVTNEIVGRIDSFEEYDIFNTPRKVNMDCSKKYWRKFYSIPINSIINIEKVS